MSTIVSNSVSPIAESSAITTGSSLAKETTVALVGRVLGRLFHICGQIIVARLFGPAGYGLYGLCWTIIRIVGTVAPLGLENGVLYFGSKYRYSEPSRFRSVLVECIGLAFGTGALFSLLLYWSTPFVATTLFDKPDLMPILRLVSPIFVSIAILRVAAAATRISQRMSYSILAEDLSQPAINLLLVAALYFTGWELYGAVISLSVSFAFASAIALFQLYSLFHNELKIHKTSTILAGQLIRFALPTSAATTFGVLIVWSDRLMVGYLGTAADVGIYQAISQISLFFAIVLAGLNNILASIVSDALHRQDYQYVNSVFKVMTKWGFYISLPVALLLCFFPHQIIMLCFGKQYLSGAIPLIVLALTQLFNVATGGVNILLVMSGNQKIWMTISGITLAINIILNYILIDHLGLLGAAIATAVSTVILFGVGLVVIYRSMNLWPYDSRYYKGIWSALVVIILLIPLAKYPVEPSFGYLSLAGLITCGSFFGMLWWLGLDPEDQIFIRPLLWKFRPKS